MNVIVIPCYNEAKRLKISLFEAFLEKTSNVIIVFSNDGSTDDTLVVLEQIESKFQEKVNIVYGKTNKGKAAAVRSGILYSQRHLDFEKIAYLDADLSISLEECLRLFDAVNENILFAFGSRVLKLDNNIERKYHHFLIERFLATVISKQLQLRVYDMQCGCKIFSRDLSNYIFKDEFISKWLFDVEIFYRIIGLTGLARMKHVSREISLYSWVDTDNSKLKLRYFFNLWLDLYKIRRKYSNVS